VDALAAAQFRSLQADMAARGFDVAAALTPSGEIDYIYQVDRVLTVDVGDNLPRVERVLEGARRVDPEESRVAGGVAEYSLEGLGGVTVPEVLDFFDEQESARLSRDGLDERERQQVAAVNVLHITRICPAGEPEVPAGGGAVWPPLRADGAGAGVLIGISDTGLLENLDTAGRYPWLAGVVGAGDPDRLPPPSFTGVQNIPLYAGHGTFCAGVARSVAPAADVVVNNHMTTSGGELETEFCRNLIRLLQGDVVPQVLSLSAGTYTRNDSDPLSFVNLYANHLSQLPNVQLVAAAGNDSQDRKFWPAAFDWCVGVGALGADEQHRAWFSNFGSWVDVYAPGEGMVNAYPTGTYTYHEPPKAPAQQDFAGMARWNGTSFSTPFVAGLIAGRMAREQETAPIAAQRVVNFAPNRFVRSADTP
jgi:subtilisin family serine protease